MKIAIAGGGTGGHLFPALAVAEVMRARGHDVLIFISEKEVDSLATRDRAEFRFEKLPGVGMPRLLSPAIVGFARAMLESRSACCAAYKRFRPDAVLGMGGFTSTVPIIEGCLRRLPTFLHESNAIPGKANRLNARFANVVFLGFGDCARHFGDRRCEVTGTPIRRELLERIPRQEALASFNLDPSKRTVLVMGGSQGAKGINEAMIRALPHLKGLDLQAIHLAGQEGDQIADANYRREGIPAHVSAFCHRMASAYSAVDFAVARSGAASLTELSWFGLPSILVPYPYAAEDHQTLNAQIFERAGAAKILPQAECDGPNLAAAIKDFIAEPARWETMSARARSLAPEGAADRIMDTIEGFIR